MGAELGRSTSWKERVGVFTLGLNETSATDAVTTVIKHNFHPLLAILYGNDLGKTYQLV